MNHPFLNNQSVVFEDTNMDAASTKRQFSSEAGRQLTRNLQEDMTRLGQRKLTKDLPDIELIPNLFLIDSIAVRNRSALLQSCPSFVPASHQVSKCEAEST